MSKNILQQRARHGRTIIQHSYSQIAAHTENAPESPCDMTMIGYVALSVYLFWIATANRAQSLLPFYHSIKFFWTNSEFDLSVSLGNALSAARLQPAFTRRIPLKPLGRLGFLTHRTLFFCDAYWGRLFFEPSGAVSRSLANALSANASFDLIKPARRIRDIAILADSDWYNGKGHGVTSCLGDIVARLAGAFTRPVEPSRILSFSVT